MDHSIKNRLLICFHFLLGGIWQCSFVYEAGVSDWAFVCVTPHFTHDLSIYHTSSNWHLHWEREKVRIKGTSQRGRCKHLEYKSTTCKEHKHQRPLNRGHMSPAVQLHGRLSHAVHLQGGGHIALVVPEAVLRHNWSRDQCFSPPRPSGSDCILN